MKHKQAGIYARVSSEQQVEVHTIDSQVSTLLAQAQEDGVNIADELHFIDDGYSGIETSNGGILAVMTVGDKLQ